VTEKFSERLFREVSPCHSEMCCACGGHHAKNAAARVIQGSCIGVTGNQRRLIRAVSRMRFYGKIPKKKLFRWGFPEKKYAKGFSVRSGFPARCHGASY
jgi:hypothetical protein